MNLINLITNQTKVLKSDSALQAKLTKLLREKQVILVALCGETAAGKTTLTQMLKRNMSTLSVISADHYFRDMSGLIKQFGSFTKLVESGYYTDCPDSFQMDVLRADLIDLKSGREIQMPRYDMLSGSSTPKATPCRPTKIVMVEGICTLYPEIRDLFDFKIYLTVDKNLQWERYQNRASERGQNPDNIRRQFEIISQAAQRYILPNKAVADLIIETRDMSKRKIATHPLVNNQRHPQNERV